MWATSDDCLSNHECRNEVGFCSSCINKYEKEEKEIKQNFVRA